MDKLWIIGYLLCWPLKITFFCEIARLLMKAFGLNCNAVSVVDPGSGESYVAAERVIDDMSNGMKVTCTVGDSTRTLLFRSGDLKTTLDTAFCRMTELETLQYSLKYQNLLT